MTRRKPRERENTAKKVRAAVVFSLFGFCLVRNYGGWLGTILASAVLGLKTSVFGSHFRGFFLSEELVLLVPLRLLLRLFGVGESSARR